MKAIIFITLFLFSSNLFALSCMPSLESECHDISDVDKKHSCIVNARLKEAERKLDNKMKANNCMLSNKMKRREFLQSQCKTTVLNLNPGCQAADYCLPNALEGQIVNAYTGKFVKEVDTNAFFWGDNPFRKCTKGQWEIVETGKGI